MLSMIQKLYTLIRSKTFRFVMIGVLVFDGLILLVFAHENVTSAGVSRAGITLLTPSVDIDPKIQEDILTLLAQEAPARGIFNYAITSVDKQDQYTRVSVAGFQAGNPEPWTLEDAIWLGSVTIPNGLEAGGIVDTLPQTPAAAAPQIADIGGGPGDILPFAKDTQAQYGMLGVHNCGFGLNGWRAVDLFPSVDRVYAAQSAEISYVCRDGTQMSIRAGDFMYVHLVDNGMQVGDQLVLGQPISSMVPGTFSAMCGNAEQSEGTRHVHFCFVPDGNVYTTDGYTLDLLSSVWTKGEEAVEPLGYLTATWQDANITPGSPVGGNFWDGIAQGIDLMVDAIVPTLPVHETMGIAETVIQTAQAPLDLVYAVVLANFNMTICMWVFGIIMTMEAVRLIYSAWMWVKNAVPFAG